MSYTEISKCRVSGSSYLVPVLDLGTMAMTGNFPKTAEEDVPNGPISLVYCPDSKLLQMKQSYDLGKMYGRDYGYRSGLNPSMVRHLTEKAQYLQRIRPVDAESTVIDIGGNDGTFLKAYQVEGLTKISVDPTTRNWLEFHRGTSIIGIADFFPSKVTLPMADIITSIACFYDLEDPQAFVNAIAKQLKPDGIWHFEQSYMPAMLAAGSYDTVCHEHLEYYTLGNVVDLLAVAGMKVVDVQFNDVNGGSFAVTACLASAKFKCNPLVVNSVLETERHINLSTLQEFAKKAVEHRTALRTLLRHLKAAGHSIGGCGASTKGNVMLQFCGFTDKDIEYIADVNPNKHGCFTPGSKIPIVSEEYAKRFPVDYKLVLPWHFKDSIIEREKEFLDAGGRLIFPLPSLQIVGKQYE